jgi:hypothetical protein
VIVISPGRSRDGVVDRARIDAGELLDILAARARFLALIFRTEIGPDRVVELKITAAGVVKGAHRLAIGLGKIVKEVVEIGISLLADRRAAAAIVQNRWRGNRHLRHRPRVRFQELEVREDRMIRGKIELAGHAHVLGVGLHAAELNALARVL